MTEEKMKYKVKDSVFCNMFSSPNYLLELYKTLHPEDTEVTEDDLETITLEPILLNGLYNDLGFSVNDRMIILVEAQSTWSINIVVRSLLYLLHTIEEYIHKKSINLYSKIRIKLPKPEMYVIYTKERGENPEYISFQEEYFPEGCCINAKVKVLYLDESDSIINQYIKFCLVLDDQKKIYGRTKKAIEETIRICMDNNILVEYLSSRKVEVQDIMWNLFNQEWITEVDRIEVAKEAEQKGRLEGKAQTTIDNIKSLMESTKWTAVEAMSNLKIPVSEQAKYLAMIYYNKRRVEEIIPLPFFYCSKNKERMTKLWIIMWKSLENCG